MTCLQAWPQAEPPHLQHDGCPSSSGQHPLPVISTGDSPLHRALVGGLPKPITEGDWVALVSPLRVIPDLALLIAKQTAVGLTWATYPLRDRVSLLLHLKEGRLVHTSQHPCDMRVASKIYAAFCGLNLTV